MKSTARVYPPARVALFALALFMAFGVSEPRAQNEPILVPDAVDYQKLMPILANSADSKVATRLNNASLAWFRWRT